MSFDVPATVAASSVAVRSLVSPSTPSIMLQPPTFVAAPIFLASVRTRRSSSQPITIRLPTLVREPAAIIIFLQKPMGAFLCECLECRDSECAEPGPTFIALKNFVLMLESSLSTAA